MDVHDSPAGNSAPQDQRLGAEQGDRFAVLLESQLAFARHPGQVAPGVSGAVQELRARACEKCGTGPRGHEALHQP